MDMLQNAETDRTVEALGALAQDRRLAVFRLLARTGAAGLPAGDIAECIGIPHNTLSTHLGILVRAGLLKSRREGRQIIYQVDFDGTRRMLEFLLEDCCQGAAAACRKAVASVLPKCC